MRVTDAFIANAAEVRDGLLYVLGGFPEWWTLPELPARSQMALVIVAELDGADLDKPFEFQIHLLHAKPNDQLLATVGFMRGSDQPRAADGSLRQILAIPMSVTFESPGRHTFTVTDQTEKMVASFDLLVRKR